MGSGLFLCNVLLGRVKLVLFKINLCSRVFIWNVRNCRWNYVSNVVYWRRWVVFVGRMSSKIIVENLC